MTTTETMTAAEFARLAGLNPWGPPKGYPRAGEGGFRPMSEAVEWGRQTGRTTAMLCRAAVAGGPVLLVGPNYRIARDAHIRLRELCAAAGAKPPEVFEVSSADADRMRGSENIRTALAHASALKPGRVTVWADHTWREFTPFAKRLAFMNALADIGHELHEG